MYSGIEATKHYATMYRAVRSVSVKSILLSELPRPLQLQTTKKNVPSLGGCVISTGGFLKKNSLFEALWMFVSNQLLVHASDTSSKSGTATPNMDE